MIGLRFVSLFALMLVCGSGIRAQEAAPADALTDEVTDGLVDPLAESLSNEERVVEERANQTAVIESSAAENFAVDDSMAVIGELRTTQSMYEDTLVDIARVHGLGYEEIRLANPAVDAWLPGEGTEVRLPTQFVLPKARRSGLVINIAEYRMYYYFRDGDDTLVTTFPISIGRMDWGTPLGRAAVVKKVKDPSWYPPQSIIDEWAADGRELAQRVPPGPGNPLGQYAIRLSIPGYLIHGTNRPAGVGMRVTHGCIRMFPEDIEHLFPSVPVNTAVQIVNQPFKFGWQGDDLYLEVHPPLETTPTESAGVEDPNGTDPWSLTSITELYIRVTDTREANVNWKLIDQVYAERLGIPVHVGTARVPGEAVAAVVPEPVPDL